MEETISVPERSFISIHGLVITVALLLPLLLRWLFYDQSFVLKDKSFRPSETYSLQSMTVRIGKTVAISVQSSSKVIFEAVVGVGIPCFAQYSVSVVELPDRIAVTFPGYAKLLIQVVQEGTYHIRWTSDGAKVLEDHIVMSGCHWYGGGHVFRHFWPMEKWDTEYGPHVTGEAAPLPFSAELYGGVQERAWFTSDGVGIAVDQNAPLFASFNYESNKLARLKAQFKSPYNSSGDPLTLEYTLCVAPDRNPKSAFQTLSSVVYKKPYQIPDKNMFRYPIWSTWASCKTAVTQEKVIKLAENLKRRAFKAAQIEIDDGWSTGYGDLTFNPQKFPDPKNMVDHLRKLGFPVTLWIHPFVNFTSTNFRTWWKSNGLVRWKPFSLFPFELPAVISWWNGYSAMVDVTNPLTADVFKTMLTKLKSQYGIKSFKVDAGEGCRLSSRTITEAGDGNPNTFTQKFAQLAHEVDPDTRTQEMRVAVNSQHLPLFFRLQDKDSNWGHFNGLRTVIPHVLTQGLLGYPFVLPDMIGGNAYSLFPWGDGRPDRELYIRWVQLNALLPAMQFSIPPWDYDDEVVDISRSMCLLHEQYSSVMLDLAHAAAETGDPIVRPLWWIAPDDPTALTISTEFLLGDDVLVAPVLEEGARERDVYLSEGRWRDELNNNLLDGARWHRSYPCDLQSLLHFTKL